MSYTPSSKTRRLLQEIDQFTYIASIVLILVLIVIYYFIWRWKPVEDEMSLGVREFFLALIINFIPVFVLFAGSYAILRRIQSIKFEQESEDLADLVASKTQSVFLEKFRNPGPEWVRLKSPSEYEAFEKYVSGAKEIFVVGSSLSAFTQLYRFKIEQLIKDGCHLKAILIDPESVGVEIAAGWAARPTEKFKGEILNSLDHLQTLAVKAKGRVAVRLTSSPPALSLLMIDGAEHHGKLRLDTIPPRCNPQLRPHFELTKKDNERWYQFFYDDFQDLWNGSTEFISSKE